MKKEIVYVDMDGVLFDFDKGFQNLPPEQQWIEGQEKTVPAGFFTHLEFIEGAKEAIEALSEYYDVYILSTPQWSNHASWAEKCECIKLHFPEILFKKLILSHNKGLLKGSYLIDDRIANGVDGFEGKHIHFGTDMFPNWASVIDYLVLDMVDPKFW